MGIHQVGQPTLLCGSVCGEGVREGTMLLAWPSPHFQSLPLLPTSKLGPSGAYSHVCGFMYILGPRWSLYLTLLWNLAFLLLPQPAQVFTSRGFEALFPWAGTLDCVAHLSPQLFRFICTQMWDCLQKLLNCILYKCAIYGNKLYLNKKKCGKI